VSLASLVLLAVGATGALAASHTATATASAGGTSATFTYVHSTGATAIPYSGAHLSITHNGQSLFDAPVNALLCRTQCWPALDTGTPTLSLIDIEHDGSPDVILNLYSGGAHCCYVTQIYRYDPGTQTYAIVQHDFGDPGARLETLNVKCGWVSGMRVSSLAACSKNSLARREKSSSPKRISYT